MKRDYKEHSEEGGVYRITNTVNDRVYVGSTHKFKSRAYEHEKALVENRHHCKFLQADFNKCGSDVFTFEVVEVVKSPDLDDKAQQMSERIKKEQGYIDTENVQGHLYNSRKVAIDIGYHVWCEESKKNQGKAVRARFQNNPELRAKCAKRVKDTMWKDHSVNLELVNKNTGEEVLVTGSLREWCLARGLNYKAIHLLKQGKTKISGGWYLKTSSGPPVYVSQKGQVRKPLSESHKAKIAGGKFLGMKILSPSGKTVELPANIKAFCRDNGSLDYTTFLRVLGDKLSSCQGWKKLS